jgi:alkanesulfonate monooxygenase SsuD/methylene tetrahydromethanopterin reductase-like flavin-dependent oxidoreductase (luciferase family)
VRVGLVIMDPDPADAVRVAHAADRAGVHSVWSADFYNRSSLTRAAAFAAVTESAIVGTSVTPLFARAPLALAAAASDLQAMAAGRFVLGVGSSTWRMNRDWYDFDLAHPAPQVSQRVELLRKIFAHRSGPFAYEGRFDKMNLAHFDRARLPTAVPIFAAGVGPRMVSVAGQSCDGFVGHPIASNAYLQEQARPLIAASLTRTGRESGSFFVTSQIVAVADPDVPKARAVAARQVGFYATVRGYDNLFPGGIYADERAACRKSFVRGDVEGVTQAALPMVDERAVYGTVDDVASQLRRYDNSLDWALLYPPHYAVEPEQILANEMRLIEVAAGWTA